uniref:DNA2/NAM7 helicase-like C-terminal domain-containing protein n=1 Tax=Meloidogyne javanica TaxID=6303 RepID=A0A915LRC7_MELJA
MSNKKSDQIKERIGLLENMEADLLALGPDESDMDLEDHQISEALEAINEVDFTKNASFATIILKKANEANIGKMEKEMLEKFANQGFDEKMEEDVIMDDRSYNCIVCQTAEKYVTVTPVRKGPKEWPDFISVDQEWASKDERVQRPLRMGDLVEVISCTRLEYDLKNLSEAEKIAKHLKQSGMLMCMAKATNVKSVFKLSKREIPGIVLDFQMCKKTGKLRFAEVWQEDCPISVKLNYPEAKPCASGYVLENERSVYYEGFMFKAKLLLAFQPARKYDAESDFEMIKEGAEIKISPTASINALEMRMESFSYNLLSEIASLDTPKGKVTKILLGLAEKSEYPKLNMTKLRQSHPVLARLQTSQGDTAMLMLDERPRGVFQQAPPGTGKTYTAMSIVAATMKMFPEAHILCMAPLNIAVVKMCLELEEAMKIEGIQEPVLALFSGNGKTRYKEQIESISTHLLAHAVDSPEFTSKLELTDLKKIDRYKKACISHPRLASEGTIAQLLLEQILEALTAIGFKGSIRVICLYAAQATEIGREVADRELPGIQTLSADAMQGHETDLAIVVTTATQRGENTTVDNSREFWADPARVNVALSRGKHALILIGDL